MKYIKKISIFLISGFLFSQDSYSIDWKQIRTDNYQIIFPLEISSEAQRVANIMENIHSDLQLSADIKHKRVPIVLRNRSSIPNAYVSLAPRMSEWFNVPIMIKGMGTNEWYEDLAIHEGRHIAQYNFADYGTARLVKTLFGESAFSMFTNFLLPSWYWEGDAVGIETAFSNSGRGRVPYFDVLTRDLALSGLSPSYQQILFGSYKNVYPDQYEIGYLLTNHIKSEYGLESLPSIVKTTLRWPFTLNPFLPFSRSVKKITGSNIKDIYSDAMYDFKSSWEDQINAIDENELELITEETKIRTNYRFATESDDRSIVALKYGIADTPKIVRINNGNEKDILSLSSSVMIFGFHSNGNQAIWSYYNPDKRWTKQSWADVEILDLQSNKIRRISNKSRIYSPNISKDGSKIVATSFSEERVSLLVIMDSETGKILDRALPPDKGIVMFPSWSEDAKRIVFISQSAKGRTIYIYDTIKRKFNKAKDPSWDDISRPIFYNNYILFESPYKGVDNILALNLKEKEEYLVTSSRFGAYYPSIADNRILFSDYQSTGEKIVTMKLDIASWKRIPNVRYDPIRFYKSTYAYNDQQFSEKKSLIIDYDIDSYNHYINLFNFHSRYIFNDMMDPSIGIASDNILGTLSLSSDISYNQNEEVNKIRAGLEYKRYYPIINLEISSGNRKIDYKNTYRQLIEGVNDTLEYKVKESWNEFIFEFSTRLSLLNKFERAFNSQAYFQFGSQYISRTNSFYNFSFPNGVPFGVQVNSKQELLDSNGGILPVYLEAFYTKFHEKSSLDIDNIGVQIYAFYGASPFGGFRKGSQLYFYMRNLMNGFVRHHQIISVIESEQNQRDNIFSTKMDYPVGSNWSFFKQGYKIKLKYQLPLAYPDYSLPAKLAYIKRIRLLTFTDIANIDNILQLSLGAGLTFDVGGFFDFKFPLPITTLFYYLPKSNDKGFKIRFN